MEKLQWTVKNDVDFTKEFDVLETILHTCGIEDIQAFLHPTQKYVNDGMLMKNMEDGLTLLHKVLTEGKKILLKVDCDVDGQTSSSYMYQFIKENYPNVEITYRLSMNKVHGLMYEDVALYPSDEFGLIIVPDASVAVQEAEKIKQYTDTPILILDHHCIEDEERDMLKYATVINCTEGDYPNPTLSGVGVVHKFCVEYCKKYDIDIFRANKFIDLVALGQIADSTDLRNLETRYFVIQGLKEENHRNELIREMAIAYDEDMKFGHTITNYGWVIAPKINATVRYGKEQEQIDLFRAFIGEQEDIEYQPRRKSKNDPLPPKEIHSLQKTMARVCKNVKSRQDTEVRKFMKEAEEYIEKNNLTENSVLILDGTDIFTKATVTGLVANKIASKYKRPILILKSFSNDYFGGSGRNYGQGKVKDLRQMMLDTGFFDKVAGHPSAFGIMITKDNIPKLQECCNKQLPLSDLVTIHQVDYEIPAKKLKNQDIQNVANSYEIWGNTVPEPLFAITDLEIDAKDIKAYGENKGFIRFMYNGVCFIKKYCAHTDWANMTLTDRNSFGASNKKVKLNLICNFSLNEYEGKVTPQVRIVEFDSEEVKRKKDDIPDDFVF